MVLLMIMLLMMMVLAGAGGEAVLVSHTYEGCMHDPLFSTANGDSVPNHHDRICWHQNCYT